MSALACAALKLAYWNTIDETPAASTPESATGRHAWQSARFERPHTEENYLTKEMGFVLARKHAAPLRAIALACGIGIPLRISAARGRWVSRAETFNCLGGVGLRQPRHFCRTLVFFCPGAHTVMLYYGAQRA